MKKFFAYVKAHYGYFFWLGWLYFVVIAVATALLSPPGWVAGLLMLPMNLITIPVATEVLDSRRNKPWWLWSRGVSAQLVVSLLYPLMMFFMS